MLPTLDELRCIFVWLMIRMGRIVARNPQMPAHQRVSRLQVLCFLLYFYGSKFT